MERNIELDFLKIMACFAVVTLHVAGLIAIDNGNCIINHILYFSAVFAVPIFFMVNGCLLLNRSKMSYQYILKKVLNIFLIIFSWNILIFFSKLILRKKIVNPFYMSLKNLIQKDYFAQFWFFGALIIIYLILPIIHNYFSNLKSAIIITGVFFVISVFIDILSLIRSINGESIIQIYFIQTFRLWTWIAYYLLGGLFGKKQIKEYIFKHINARFNWIMFLISLLIINVYQYNISFLYNNSHAEFFYDNFFTFIYIISIFLLVSRQNLSKYKFKVIIEPISYNAMGIYIIHLTIIKIFTHFYKFNTSIKNVCLIFIVFIISLIISLVISKLPYVNRLVKI